MTQVYNHVVLKYSLYKSQSFGLYLQRPDIGPFFFPEFVKGHSSVMPLTEMSASTSGRSGNNTLSTLLLGETQPIHSILLNDVAMVICVAMPSSLCIFRPVLLLCVATAESEHVSSVFLLLRIDFCLYLKRALNHLLNT